MKTFLQNVLMLGGFYFIASFLLSFLGSKLDTLCLGIWFLALLILCFKKHFYFLDNIKLKHPAISNYLLALGCMAYLGVVIGLVSGFYEGYSVAMAQYNNQEYHSQIPEYLSYLGVVYIVGLIAALLWATYKSFVHQKKS